MESFKKLVALRRNTFPLARQVTVKRVFGGHGSGGCGRRVLAASGASGDFICGAHKFLNIFAPFPPPLFATLRNCVSTNFGYLLIPFPLLCERLIWQCPSCAAVMLLCWTYKLCQRLLPLPLPIKFRGVWKILHQL